MIFFSDIIKKKKKCEKGSALYFSLVIMAVILSIVVGLGVILKTQIKTIKDIELSVPAFYLADAGIEEALYNVRIESLDGSFDGEIPDFGGYNVKVVKDTDLGEICGNNYCLRSVGVYEGIRRAIETAFDTGVLSPKEQARSDAQEYCLQEKNFGVTTHDGDVVYCDEYGNMWSTTLLNKAGTAAETYAWAKDENDEDGEKYSEQNVWKYTYGEVNDCNEVKPEEMENFPACNACATLDYAGFQEGWRLPYQTIMEKRLVEEHCNVPCGRGSPDPGLYCAPDRQLWDFGAKQCPIWGKGDDGDNYGCKKGYGAGTGAGDYCGNIIKENWDLYSFTGAYWSAIQNLPGRTWTVHFGNAYTDSKPKKDEYWVRCFLGEW